MAAPPPPPPPPGGPLRSDDNYRINRNFVPHLDTIFERYRPKAGDAREIINNNYGLMRAEIENEINRELDKVFVSLKTTNQRVHNAIMNIKNQFINNRAGNKVILTSQEAKDVSDRLGRVSRQINVELGNLTTIPVPRRGRDNFDQYNTNDGVQGEDIIDARIGIIRAANPVNIDSYNLSDSVYQLPASYDTINVQNPADLQTLERRLANCTGLEYLYLRKHAELLNVFSLTINLYDKYTMALNLLMFLIKYLVKYNAESGKGIGEYNLDCKVKIPKPVIKNLNALLRDQESIQDTIRYIRQNTNGTDNFMRNTAADIATDLNMRNPPTDHENPSPARNTPVAQGNTRPPMRPTPRPDVGSAPHGRPARPPPPRGNGDGAN